MYKRQLLYNALKVIGKLPQGDSGKTLDHFSDAGQIDSWAKEAMTLLVKTGTIGGNAGKLNPTSTTTRAPNFPWKALRFDKTTDIYIYLTSQKIYHLSLIHI